MTAKQKAKRIAKASFELARMCHDGCVGGDLWEKSIRLVGELNRESNRLESEGVRK